MRLACLRNGYNLEHFFTEKTVCVIKGDPHPGGIKTNKQEKAENAGIEIKPIHEFEDIVQTANYLASRATFWASGKGEKNLRIYCTDARLSFVSISLENAMEWK